MSDCNSIHSILKFAGNVFMSTENGVKNIEKKNFFWNLETYLQIPLSK